MKKSLTIGIAAYLFVMFLVYAGVFRDNSNPSVVAAYFFESLRNSEPFLSFQVCTGEYFDYQKLRWDILKYKLYSVNKVHLKAADIKGTYANIEADLLYRDAHSAAVQLKLVKKGGIWLIKNVLYRQVPAQSCFHER